MDISYARQGVERIPMVHEGPDARAMEKCGIPTEVGKKNRAIRQQNKLIEQLEARPTRLNAWAQFEKKMDEALIAKGKDVSDPNLRYILASCVFSSTVPPKRKDNRLRDGTGLLAIIEPEFPYIAVCTSSRADQSNEMLNVYPGETVFPVFDVCECFLMHYRLLPFL